MYMTNLYLPKFSPSAQLSPLHSVTLVFLFVFNKEAGLLTYILLNWDILWCILMQTTYLDEVVWQL